MNIKKFIPRTLKKIPWYILKAPQRNPPLYISFIWEVKAFFRWAIYGVFRKNNSLKPVTICTGLKNRSRNYIEFVLASAEKIKHKNLVYISVFDCGSDDFEWLKNEVETRWKNSFIISKNDCNFTRAYSFNKAIEQAKTELIFAADVDMSLPENLVELCNKYVSKNTVWFPICFNLKKDKPAINSAENGEWFEVGKGMFASTKEQFFKAGKYDERYIKWGGEDWDLWMRFFNAGFLPIRTKCKGLFHHYHESLKPPLEEGKKDYLL